MNAPYGGLATIRRESVLALPISDLTIVAASNARMIAAVRVPAAVMASARV